MNNELWNELKRAVQKGNYIALLSLLKQQHQPLDSPDPSNGWPLLFYAIAYGQLGLVESLLAQETTLRVQTDFNRNSALVIAAEYAQSEVFLCARANSYKRGI